MLRVDNVSVSYGDHAALAGIDIDVADGSVLSILGPSGSGKTTLLRVVAGLLRPDSGTVRWDEKDLTAVPAYQRGFGLMFQDFALFPHRDVAGNVEFGLRMQSMPPKMRRALVAEALARVGLAGFEHRAVGTLSGGEAQRVALARSLAPSPKLLMLDEPLGSVDAALRESLMADMARLLADLGTTTIYVTHDRAEAFGMADRVAVMHNGSIAQAGKPEDIWLRPRNEFVARFLGLTNFVDAAIDRGRATTIWGIIPVGHHQIGGRRRLVVRPDALRVTSDGEIAGTVDSVTFHGDHFSVRVRTAHGPPLTMTSRHRLRPGTTVRLAVDPDGVVILGEG